jgi:hypothetical protein
MANPGSIIDGIRTRFNNKVNITGHCHLWKAALDNGYGVMKLKWPGYPSKRGYAYRISYVLNNLDKFPTFNPVHQISHTCHNIICLNPKHLIHEDATVNAWRQTCHANGRCSKNYIDEARDSYRDCVFV